MTDRSWCEAHQKPKRRHLSPNGNRWYCWDCRKERRRWRRENPGAPARWHQEEPDHIEELVQYKDPRGITRWRKP